MKVLITGSSGMLGCDLCGTLSPEHDVVGIDTTDPPAGSYGPRSFQRGDITDAETLAGIVSSEDPDVVIHAAAMTDVDGCELDPEEAERINVEGTRNIVYSLRGSKAKLIFISTDFVFDGRKTAPYREEDTPSPVNIYGRTKREAEAIIESGMERYAIVRTSWLFGKNGRNFVDTIIAKAGSGVKLRVVDDQTGSPTYTKDLSAAIKVLLETPGLSGREIFHISNSGGCSWYEFSGKILDLKGLKDADIEPITSDELARPARRPRYSVLRGEKFAKATGHKMRSWGAALGDYISRV